MATLHIEHRITDYAVWKAAFDRFAFKREEAGVTSHRIHQPADDAKWVVLQLDFPSVAAAEKFRDFLQTSVWTNPAASPGLGGQPTARVLIDAPVV